MMVIIIVVAVLAAVTLATRAATTARISHRRPDALLDGIGHGIPGAS